MTNNEKSKQTVNNFIESLKAMTLKINKDVEAEKLKNKPAYRNLNMDYRFRKDIEKFGYTIDIVEKVRKLEEIDKQNFDKLEKILDLYNYEVEIINDLDCKDATSQTKYVIQIMNYDNMKVEFDLVEYFNNIREYEFDEVKFILKQLAKIEGTGKNLNELADAIVGYIAYIMYDKDNYILTYNNMGWDRYNGELLFKYDELISCNDKFRGRMKNPIGTDLGISKEDYESRIELWVKTAKNVISNPCAALIVGAGVSGVVRSLLPYTKENNININIFGRAGSGKSTIEHFILGIFGKPMMLEGSFIDTDNSIEEKRIKRPILPYVLDDRMLKLQGETCKIQARTILMDIFREYEGKVRERYGKSYDESRLRTYGPVISSSVESMFNVMYDSDVADLGQYRRFIEIGIDDGKLKLFDNNEDAEKAEQVAVKCSGIGVYLYVNYIMQLVKDSGNDTSVIEKRYISIKERLDERLRKLEVKNNLRGMVASSQRFSLIILSYKLLYEMLYLKENSGKKDQSQDIEEILLENLLSKYDRVSNMHNLKGSNENVIKFVTGCSRFKQVDSIKKKDKLDMLESNGKIYGVYTLKNNQIEIILDSRYRLAQFIYMYEIPNTSIIDKFVQKVNENGYNQKESMEIGHEEYNTYKVKNGTDYRLTNIKIDGSTVYLDKVCL